MKKFKKLLAAVSACTLLFSSLTVSAAQPTDGLADGTAYLNINNADWGDFDAEWTNVEITGDGSYTVAMKAAEPQNLAQFNALEVVNGEAVLGTGCVLTVDSIKINGEDVALQGASFTCSADGGGVTTRVNIYNEWNAPDDTATAGNDGHLDHRVAEGNLMDATAMLFSSDYLTLGITDIEVAFTVSGFGTAAPIGEAAEVTAEGPAIAHLNINKGDWSEFDAEYGDVEITGDGSYTVTMTATEPVDMGAFNALEVENGELLMGNGSVITIDSIVINGEEITLEGPSYTCSADGAGITTRVNLYNEYNDPDDTATDQRVADGNLMDATARVIPADLLVGVTSLEVNFTVSNYGVFNDAEGGDSGSAAAVDLNGTYHGYLGIQTPKFSFRNAFDDATYGRDTEYFNQVTGWDESNNALVLPGTFHDVEIKGNGTYTVSVDGLEFPNGEFDSQDYMNLIFLSTDIPNSGEITISDVKLTVDGRDVALAAAGAVLGEDKAYMEVGIQNIWSDDIKEIGFYTTPMSSMSITFTVSGFAYDAAPAEEAPSTDTAPVESAAPAETTESGSNTGLIVGIVAAVVVVAGGAAGVVVAKKKKGNK
ncbi:MAG: hypothetical protein J1E83_13370 [Lachnospiraceae bacterium]|nr:hypothetical protein [Lachnospiraceae bacterium]